MRRRLMLRNSSGSGGTLPSEYQAVEYISNSASGAYLETLFVPHGNTTYFLRYTLNVNNEADRMVFGSNDGDYFEPYAYYQDGSQYQSRIYARNNTSRYQQIMVSGAPQFVEMSADYIKINGVDYPKTATVTVTRELPIYIFAWNNNGAPEYYIPSGSKIYYLRCELNGIAIADFVPCYRKADGVIGMFDTVAQVFYTNAGTGTFTKGADV